MAPHLGLQRIMIPSAQVSSLTTGSITLPSARGAFTASAFESISTTTLGGASSTISFTSIPDTYQHLQLRIVGRGGRALFLDNMIMSFNSDSTTSNYYNHGVYGDGTSLSPSSDGGSYVLLYTLAGANAGSNIFGSVIIDIVDYANTNKNKTVRYLGGVDNNGQGLAGFGSGAWYSASAITSLQLTLSTGASFQANTTVALYGIKG